MQGRFVGGRFVGVPHIHTQFTTFLLVLLLDLQAGQLAPDSHVGNSTVNIGFPGQDT
jgi:hypothetical protein